VGAGEDWPSAGSIDSLHLGGEGTEGEGKVKSWELGSDSSKSHFDLRQVIINMKY
jgi:hypothetical protein